jgi:hypothetical protein
MSKANPVCTECGGALVPSQYGGYLHADDGNDTHTPRLDTGAHPDTMIGRP